MKVRFVLAVSLALSTLTAPVLAPALAAGPDVVATRQQAVVTRAVDGYVRPAYHAFRHRASAHTRVLRTSLIGAYPPTASP